MEKKIVTLNRIIFVLSLVGFIIAIYVLQSFLRGTNIVCVNSGCEIVRKSAYSKIMGIPVPAFGLVGYFFMLVLAFLRTVKENINFLKGILGIAVFGIFFTGWFTYTELFLIKGICTWCAISAINMWVIFFLILGSYRIYIHKQK